MIDTIILIFLGIFIIYGFFSGLVKMVLNLLSSVLAIIFAIKYYQTFYEFFPFVGFGSDSVGSFVSFILILTLSLYILSIGFKLLARVLKIISSLPIISFANKLAGAAFGLVQGLFILGAIFFFLSSYSFLNTFFDSIVSNSEISPFLIKAVVWIEPFVPEAIDAFRSIM
ncbi:MAG: CvpA family protein [Patescibacteria group bacterium]